MYLKLFVFSLSTSKEIKAIVPDIDLLKVFTSFGNATIDGLKSELLAYLTAAEVVSTDVDPMV